MHGKHGNIPGKALTKPQYMRIRHGGQVIKCCLALSPMQLVLGLKLKYQGLLSNSA